MFLLIATGEANVSVCHPDVVSPVKVPVASWMPLAE